MQELYRRNIDAFFDHISPFRDGYRHSGLSYLAIKKDGDFILSQGRVFLHNAPPTLPLTHFISENVRAGYYTLAEMGLDVGQLKDQLISGAVLTPHGKLLFPAEDEKGHQSTYLPFHHEGLKAQNRLSVLMIFGNAQDKYDASAYLDWELMAAPTPYSSVTELMFEYRLGPSLLDRRNIEFIAFNVAGFDTSSRINGAEANIVVNLTKGLEAKDVRVGYRVFSQNQVASRGQLIGTQLEWQETDLFQQGTTSLKVAEASVVHGFLSYAGVAQQHFWIADPELSQNSRRVTYETFDNKISQLKDFLQSQGNKQHHAY